MTPSEADRGRLVQPSAAQCAISYSRPGAARNFCKAAGARVACICPFRLVSAPRALICARSFPLQRIDDSLDGPALPMLGPVEFALPGLMGAEDPPDLAIDGRLQAGATLAARKARLPEGRVDSLGHLDRKFRMALLMRLRPFQKCFPALAQFR